MSIIWAIYLGDVVNGLGTFACIAGLLSTVICGVFAVMSISDDTRDSDKPKAAKISKRFLVAALILWPISVLTPSKQTLYLMAAVKYGEAIAESPKVQVLGDKVYKILNDKLDEMLPTPKATGKK